MDRNLVRMFFVIAVIVLFSITAIDASNSAKVEDTNDYIEEATKLIVMVSGKFIDTPSFGAGIIFCSENNALYIATANHVVRRGDVQANDLTIKLKTQPNIVFKAELLDHFNRDMDLAVIRLKNIKEQGTEVPDFDMRVLSLPGSIRRGDDVFPVGNPNGVPWGIPVIPDRIAQIVGSGIVFQSAFISNGHSGGGLVDNGGVITGMIIKDSPPFGFATNIETISHQLEEWGYKVEWKLAAGYDVEGKWKVENHSLFHLLTFEVDGNRISGLGEMLNTNAGALGVTVDSLTDELANKYGTNKYKGVFVVDVQNDGPAFKAGIRTEDIITSFNRNDVDSPQELLLLNVNLLPSTNFEVEVFRNGQFHNFQGSLGRANDTDIFVYNEAGTRVAVKFGSAATLNGKIRGNLLTINVNGTWTEFLRRTGNFTVGFPAQAIFSVDLEGRSTGEAIQFEYKFEYPDLGNHSNGKFRAIRIRG